MSSTSIDATMSTSTIQRNVLLVEPFYSGSHKVLMDLIHDALKLESSINVDFVMCPGKKWHWRARTSALYFSQTIPFNKNYTYVKCACRNILLISYFQIS